MTDTTTAAPAAQQAHGPERRLMNLLPAIRIENAGLLGMGWLRKLAGKPKAKPSAKASVTPAPSAPAAERAPSFGQMLTGTAPSLASSTTKPGQGRQHAAAIRTRIAEVNRTGKAIVHAAVRAGLPNVGLTLFEAGLTAEQAQAVLAAVEIDRPKNATNFYTAQLAAVQPAQRQAADPLAALAGYALNAPTKPAQPSPTAT